VFGATGACGRALCAELVSRADESTKVFGFVRDVAKAQVSRHVCHECGVIRMSHVTCAQVMSF